MAATKSAANPHKWDDGTYHSISQAAHSANTAPAAAPPKPAATPAPVKPTAVTPFLTADDIDQLNAFNTDLATKLQTIKDTAGDFDPNAIDPATGKPGVWTGGSLEADTNYQKSQTDKGAVAASSSANDDAISRGIFSSSLKDAVLYDIESQRYISDKFLNDKLIAARLSAGAQKLTLGTAKTNFDANQASRMAANAQAVNDPASSAWASAQAAWAAANPEAAAAAAGTTATGAPAKGVVRPGTPAPAKGVVRPGTTPKPANQASGYGSTNPKGKPSKVTYGG